MQSLEGLLGFAQKVEIKKGGDAVGKTCSGFLADIDVFKWVLGGMMSDGSAETLGLIRCVDTEDADTATLNTKISHFLDHLYWLFFEDGVLSVCGHTTFIIEWIESKPHHFLCGGQSRCIGGNKVPSSVIRKAMDHMRAWVKLTKHACEAEFPSFALMACFNVFELPQQVPKDLVFHLDASEKHVRRLSVIFGRSTTKCLAGYKAFWHHAHAAYKASNFALSFYDAWMLGIRRGCSGHNADLRDAIEYICLRGEAFSVATSKVEQSFSKIDQLLGKNRLNASASVENMYVNLFMSADMNDGELDSVIDGAIAVWKACFPSAHTRLHVRSRRDKGVPSTHHYSLKIKDAGTKPTEKEFLHGISKAVASSSRCGASDALLASADVPLWEESHAVELAFQHNKRRKKEVEACLQDHLLPDEKDAALQEASAGEKQRQHKSFVGRMNDRLKYQNKTRAVQPAPAEFFRAKLYLDVGTTLPDEWLATVTRVQASITADIHVATMLVSGNPRSPTSQLVTVVACLRGLWVVSPSVLVAGSGPSVKYLEAITSKRTVWVSHSFQTEYASEWFLLLEIFNNAAHNWKFLKSPGDWARARAHAEKQKRPADVIALVGPQEIRSALKHCFTPAGMIAFLARSDPIKGSIGLLNM